MNRKILSLLILIFLPLVFCGITCGRKTEKSTMPINKETTTEKVTKKVVMIVAYRDYQDIEYRDTREAFDEAGYEVKIASSSLGTASGKLGGSLKVDLSFSDLRVSDFDAVVFVGGPGATEYVDNEAAHKIAQETVAQNKVLAAICISPEILAKSGVLKGKKATVWSSVVDRSPIKVLEDNGAEYVAQNVVQDGKIVTANGPAAAREFGKMIVEILEK